MGKRKKGECGAAHPDVAGISCDLDPHDTDVAHHAEREETVEYDVSGDEPLLDEKTGQQVHNIDGEPLFVLVPATREDVVAYSWA